MNPSAIPPAEIHTVDNLKKLQNEAIELANRIDAVRAIEGDADTIAA